MNNALMYEYESDGSDSLKGKTQEEDSLDPQEAKLKKLMAEKGIDPNESDTVDEEAQSAENVDTVHELDADISKPMLNKSAILTKEESKISMKSGIERGSPKTALETQISMKSSKRDKLNKSALKSNSSMRSNSKMTKRNDQFSVKDTPITNFNLTFR